MIDFSTLRPADQTAGALQRSLAAVEQLAPQLAAVLASAEKARDSALLVGTPEALTQAQSLLADVTKDAQALIAMQRQLQAGLATATAQAATASASTPVSAAAELMAWWQAQGPSLTTEITRGLRLVTAAIKAAEPPAPSTSNVTPLRG